MAIRLDSATLTTPVNGARDGAPTLGAMPANWHPADGSKPADAWAGFTFQDVKWAHPAAAVPPAIYQAVEALPGVMGTVAIGGTLNVQLDESLPKDKVGDLMGAVLEQTSAAPSVNVIFSGNRESAAGTFDPATSWYAKVGDNAKAAYATMTLTDSLKHQPGFKSADWVGAVKTDSGRIPPKVVVTVAANAPAGSKERIADMVRATFPNVDVAFAQKAATADPVTPRGWVPH